MWSTSLSWVNVYDQKARKLSNSKWFELVLSETADKIWWAFQSFCYEACAYFVRFLFNFCFKLFATTVCRLLAKFPDPVIFGGAWVFHFLVYLCWSDGLKPCISNLQCKINSLYQIFHVFTFYVFGPRKKVYFKDWRV